MSVSFGAAGPVAHINRIGTAVPEHDVHQAFIRFAETLLPERARRVFARMAERAGIEHRFSCLRPDATGSFSIDDAGFYRRGAFPGTGARMVAYEAAGDRVGVAGDRGGGGRYTRGDASDRGELHRVQRAGIGSTDCGAAGDVGRDRADDDRVHGVLCGGAGAAGGAAHRAVRARGAGAGAEFGAVHATPAGDGGSGDRAVVHAVRRWGGGVRGERGARRVSRWRGSGRSACRGRRI